MLITKENARQKQNSPSCTVWEYDFPNKELWFAVSMIHGRFPEKGRWINHECNEMFYVISWEGTIHHETGIFTIKAWDCFLCEKGKPYRIEGNNLYVTLSTAPAWYFDQYEYKDD